MPTTDCPICSGTGRVSRGIYGETLDSSIVCRCCHGTGIYQPVLFTFTCCDCGHQWRSGKPHGPNRCPSCGCYHWQGKGNHLAPALAGVV